MNFNFKKTKGLQTSENKKKKPEIQRIAAKFNGSY